MNSINRPIAKRLAYTNLIGNVDDKRGNNTMDPPIELVDHYHWMRDDLRQN